MFSKYEVYTSIQSIYCYKDTNVLKNKLGIRDYELLKKTEDKITAIKLLELLNEPVNGNYTKTHLMNIHKYIFSDIYYFAGHIRKEKISKGNTMFYPPAVIDRELRRITDVLKTDILKSENTEDDFFERLSYIMAELNLVHPFREGNGRTIREFIRVLALRGGYFINWGNVNAKEILKASILSVDDYKVLIPILKNCVTRKQQV